MSQAALGLELLDKLLEGHLLVPVRLQAHLPHPIDQVVEVRVPRQVGPQHQRVDEEADQALDLYAVPTRDRCPDTDVALLGVAGEEGLE